MISKFPNEIPIKGRVRACLEFLESEDVGGKVVVDIGSSFGWMAKEVMKRKPKRYIGVEPDPERVEHARKNVKGAEFEVGVAEKDVPVKSGVADMVTMFDVIEHVPSGTEPVALREARRVLKKNGVLLLTTPYSHCLINLSDPAWYFGHRHYSQKRIEGLAKKAGFEVESFEVKGGAWTVVYMLWFYVLKWVFRKKISEKSWLVKKDDESYSQKGVFTIFLKARRI